MIFPSSNRLVFFPLITFLLSIKKAADITLLPKLNYSLVTGSPNLNSASERTIDAIVSICADIVEYDEIKVRVVPGPHITRLREEHVDRGFCYRHIIISLKPRASVSVMSMPSLICKPIPNNVSSCLDRVRGWRVSNNVSARICMNMSIARSGIICASLITITSTRPSF